jgi:hypothetical protein
VAGAQQGRCLRQGGLALAAPLPLAWTQPGQPYAQGWSCLLRWLPVSHPGHQVFHVALHFLHCVGRHRVHNLPPEGAAGGGFKVTPVGPLPPSLHGVLAGRVSRTGQIRGQGFSTRLAPHPNPRAAGSPLHGPRPGCSALPGPVEGSSSRWTSAQPRAMYLGALSAPTASAPQAHL